MLARWCSVLPAPGGPTWPRGCGELVRRGAEVALDPRDEWIEDLHAAAPGGQRMRPVAEDPLLAAATRRVGVAAALEVLRWRGAAG